MNVRAGCMGFESFLINMIKHAYINIGKGSEKKSKYSEKKSKVKHLCYTGVEFSVFI